MRSRVKIEFYLSWPDGNQSGSDISPWKSLCLNHLWPDHMQLGPENMLPTATMMLRFWLCRENTGNGVCMAAQWLWRVSFLPGAIVQICFWQPICLIWPLFLHWPARWLQISRQCSIFTRTNSVIPGHQRTLIPGYSVTLTTLLSTTLLLWSLMRYCSTLIIIGKIFSPNCPVF